MRGFILSLNILFSILSYAQLNQKLKIFEPELQRFKMMMDADTSNLSRVISDDLIYIHSNALEENKPNHIDNIGSKKLQYQVMDMEESNFNTIGKITLTNGVVHVKGILNGNAFEVRLRYTAVYMKQKKEWKLLRWQSTKIT